MIAQQAHAALARHGIDGFEYGLICYDKWDAVPAVYRDLTADEVLSGVYPSPQTKVLQDKGIEAGDRWGINYEEALALEARLQRRNYERLLLRIEALEGK